jgi:glycosyltransferase involved in cell wall biosynthesis
MRITIITPSKNQGEYIEHCFRSVHGQSHRDFEHIVLDGMSNDETAAVAANYPCTFLQRKDSGPAQAINRGLDMATGDIICWLNADDAFWSSTTLERIVELFEEHPHVDVITGDGYYIDEAGKLVISLINERPNRLSLRWIQRSDPLLQPATFWRRNHFRLDESLSYCFDWKLWIDFWQAGLSVMYMPEYFALYRLHVSSLTYQDSASRRKEIYGMVKRYDRRLVQVVWCWIVWRMYQMAESLKSSSLKRLAGLANTAMRELSGGRIQST